MVNGRWAFNTGCELQAFLQTTTTDELYGRVLLGLDPNSTFL